MKKLKKYRKKYPYLTEDEESSISLNSSNSCISNESK